MAPFIYNSNQQLISGSRMLRWLLMQVMFFTFFNYFFLKFKFLEMKSSCWGTKDGRGFIKPKVYVSNITEFGFEVAKLLLKVRCIFWKGLKQGGHVTPATRCSLHHTRARNLYQLGRYQATMDSCFGRVKPRRQRDSPYLLRGGCLQTSLSGSAASPTSMSMRIFQLSRSFFFFIEFLDTPKKCRTSLL